MRPFRPSICFAWMATCVFPIVVAAQSASLQDLGSASWRALPEITIYRAREIVTLDEATPAANAVAVVGDRILAVGDFEELQQAVAGQKFVVDQTFAEQVIVPGFIAQHDHPMLTALTMASEVLAIEKWELPDRTIPAVKDKADFLQRLAAAESKMQDPNEPLVTWGYHPNFFGELTRSELDQLGFERPLVVWTRSAHEVILNSRAMELAEITPELLASWNETQQNQSDFEKGHFYEQGLFAVLATKVGTMIVTPEKLRAGLEIARDYMHAKGITYGNEPGGILVKQVQDGVNEVFGQPGMPFRWSFMVDGKTMCDKYDDDQQVLMESARLKEWYGGMTSQAPDMVKLFADGAIYSQLMVLREPYLDGHEGAWMTDLNVFQRAFRIYWDAGYQVNIHVNGDAGLDRVLNTLEENFRRNPRFDHRTTIIHFGVSGKDQVDRIRQLGCIVSANPYYVTALADNYSQVGLGPERADEMVRIGDVERAGISYSFHSDMPMAPADPLFLMWCGVNRITTSGRVAGPDQKASRAGALRAVTLDAAYSLRMENEIGSIQAGKLANFTILNGNPLTCDANDILNLKVWGTVHEGRVLPVKQVARQSSIQQDRLDELQLATLRQQNSRQLNQIAYPQTVKDRENRAAATRNRNRSCLCSLTPQLVSTLEQSLARSRDEASANH